MRFFADPHVGDDLVAGQHAFNQQLNLAARRFFTEKTGFDHLGVVEHQQIARIKLIGQVVKNAVGRGRTRAIEQFRATALGGGVLGDEFGGEGKVKI